MERHYNERIDAKTWIMQREGNYLHIYNPLESKDALDIIENLMGAGALKVEVLAEPGYSDQDESEREEIYVTVPEEGVPRKLLKVLMDLQPSEQDFLEDESNILRLWWDNH